MPPPGAPPPLPSPELIAYSNAHNLIAEASALFAIAALAVMLRCYVRIVMLKSFGNDDWTMVLSMLMATATLICYVCEVPLGLGKHLSVIQLDREKYKQLLKVRYVHQIVCGPAVTVVKISVAFFLLRFATKKTYRWFLYGTIIFLVAFLITCAFTLDMIRVNGDRILISPGQIFACVPVAATWDFSLRPPPLGRGSAKCFSKKTFGDIALFNAVVNCFTDFLLALLPVPLIWQLKLNLRTRISLILILSLGIFAGVAGIIRASVFNSILNDPRRFIHDKYSMWNYVELTVGIIAGSLPALKPLFARLLNVTRNMTSGGTTKASGYSDPNALGYHKQSSKSGAGIMLSELKSGNTVSAHKPHTSVGQDGAIWSEARATNSDESILPLHGLEPKSNTIVVTKDFHVS